MPYASRQLYKKLNKTVDDFFEKNGTEPTNKYLSNISKDYFGKEYSVNEINKLRQLFYEFRPVSLDHPVKHDSETDLSNFIYQDCDTLEKLSYESLTELVSKHTEQLKETDKEIMKLVIIHQYTYKEVAKQLDISRGKVARSCSKSKRMIEGSLSRDKHFKKSDYV